MARRRRPAVAPPPVVDDDPARYISRVERRTGAELPGPIDPDELLVHAHRDNHPVEVAASFVASRVIQLTGNEEVVRRGMRAVNTLGTRVAQTLGAVVGSPALERRARQLLGGVHREYEFQFREPSHPSE